MQRRPFCQQTLPKSIKANKKIQALLLHIFCNNFLIYSLQIKTRCSSQNQVNFLFATLSMCVMYLKREKAKNF